MPAPFPPRVSQVPSFKSEPRAGAPRRPPSLVASRGTSLHPCPPLLAVAAGTGRCPPQGPHGNPGCKFLGKAGTLARSLRQGLGRASLPCPHHPPVIPRGCTPTTTSSSPIPALPIAARLPMLDPVASRPPLGPLPHQLPPPAPLRMEDLRQPGAANAAGTEPLRCLL